MSEKVKRHMLLWLRLAQCSHVKGILEQTHYFGYFKVFIHIL